MTNSDVVKRLLSAQPSELRELFSMLHTEFAKKAESIYDENPEENGLIAQPYADLSDLMQEASAVFEEPELVLNSEPLDEGPTTVTQAVQASVQARYKGNPWGSR